MSRSDGIEAHFNKIGAAQVQSNLDRGDYIDDQAERARKFIEDKQAEAQVRALLSPEYSALRQASAAEASAKAAERQAVASEAAVTTAKRGHAGAARQRHA